MSMLRKDSRFDAKRQGALAAAYLRAIACGGLGGAHRVCPSTNLANPSFDRSAPGS
jgi:hypothetical protein